MNFGEKATGKLLEMASPRPMGPTAPNAAHIEWPDSGRPAQCTPLRTRLLALLQPQLLLAEVHQAIQQLVAAADHVQATLMLMFLEDSIQTMFQVRHNTSLQAGFGIRRGHDNAALNEC